MERREPAPATVDQVALVHDRGYIERIRSFGEGALDADTYMSRGSFNAALAASGAAVCGVDEALNGRKLSFGLVRPPGHHALPDRAMGFCIFNNAAVGAAHALERGVRRVLIVDWDVHHGNGTERMFYDRPEVLYFSAHQYPHFPGTGRASDTGTGDGEGFNVNVPLPAGSTDADYEAAFERILLPIANSYKPELVIISAGYDPHHADPLGDMRMTEAGFHRIASIVNESSGHKNIVALLEGGYSLEHLPGSVRASLLGLMGAPFERISSERTAAARERVDESVRIQRGYWRI
jgi:acetoin utilization deacetylase AcuC-like enzyme